MPKTPHLVSEESTARRLTNSRLTPSDEIFRLLVESVKDYAIFLLDPSGIVSTWNQGAEKIKGYRADEIIGKHFSCFYPRDAVENKWPDRELELALKDGRFTDEGRRVRKDGSTFWASVVITALRDQNGELLGFSKVTRDLTERRELEDRTRELNKELRSRIAQLIESQRMVELRNLELQKLSGQLINVQDEERRRLSRTLHDELGQELAFIKVSLEIHNKENWRAPIIETADRAISKVRNISYLLHPPLLDESGLLPALHWYFEGLEKRGELKIGFNYQPMLFPRLSTDIETTVFRVVQEAITNVYRHANSKEARVDIEYATDRVSIRVRDFGKGIALRASTGIGIRGMKERLKQLHGEFKVSRVEPGTLVEAVLPVFESALGSPEMIG